MAHKREEVQLKREECELDERQLDIKERQFGLTQKVDEHGLRMKREDAELDDRSAKRRRFEANTDEGITISAILSELGKHVHDPQGFRKKAEEIGVRLKVFEEFREVMIPGSRGPRRYQNDAAARIGEAIKKWVSDAQPAADAGIKKYFTAQQRQAPPTEAQDLYD